jgi:hypothetical protein
MDEVLGHEGEQSRMVLERVRGEKEGGKNYSGLGMAEEQKVEEQKVEERSNY